MNPSVMRAWVATKKGFDHLELIKDYPIPQIEREHDVLIKNIAVGINPVDYKRTERDQPPFKEPPVLIGADGCGTIEKIGTKVDPEKFKPGRLVYFTANIFERGCFSDYTVQDSRAISLVPEKAIEGKDLKDVAITFASLPVASFTAYTNVCIKLRLPLSKLPEPWNPKIYKNILVTGGSGGVGGFCLQLLNLWKSTLPEEQAKATNIITLCSQKNHEYALSLGATHAIDYAAENVADQILKITKKEGLDAIFDNTGGTTLNWTSDLLANGGDYVTNLAVPHGFDTSKMFFKSQNIHQTYLAYMYVNNLPHQLQELKEVGNIMGNLIAEGKIKSTVTEVINFIDIKEQLVKTAQFHSKGKVVALL